MASGKVTAQQLSKMSQQSSLMVLTADQVFFFFSTHRHIC